MPYSFVLPTTSSFAFSECFECDSHPSLPLNASTYRGVAKDALKKHKRLDSSSQVGHLSTVRDAINDYLPYVLAVERGLHDKALPNSPNGDIIRVRPKSTTPSIKWRPTLSGDIIPGRDRSRVKISHIWHEIAYMMAAQGFTYSQEARAVLQPLYATSNDFLSPDQRTAAISSASKYLINSASTFKFAGQKLEGMGLEAPCVDVSHTLLLSLSALAHAEATLLAVLKDDPYPAAVAQDRNKNDKDWMFKAPEIPKVRASLYSRLCVAAYDCAARSLSLAQASVSGGMKVDGQLLKYIENLQRTSRAKACRFLGISAELGGETAEGIGWLQVGLQELGVEIKGGKGISLSSLKKELSEIMEDRRVEKERAWGADAGRLEETRVIEMLSEKWNKINDTVGSSHFRSRLNKSNMQQMNTKAIPSANSLKGQIPSGRDLVSVPEYTPPEPYRNVLEAMRAPPDPKDDYIPDMSSDDEIKSPEPPVGAFPGTGNDYSRSSTAVNSYY